MDKNDNLQHVAFVGTAISNELCEQSPACSMAGNRFQLSIIRGLEKQLGQSMHVVSVQPIAMYPRSRKLFLPRGVSRVSVSTLARLIPFPNLPILKQLSMVSVIFTDLVGWLWRTRKSESRLVLVYNVFAPFSLAVLGATTLMRCKSIAIIADLPFDVYDFKGVVRGIGQHIDFFIQKRVIRRFSANIPLTRQIALDFAPGRPMLVVEGGVEFNEKESIEDGASGYALASPADEKTILYSGALNSINGIDLLLTAFRILDDARCRLHIFGRGPMESLVREASRQDPRIIYGGVVSNEEIRSRQAKATCLINPRPSHHKITHYTFPSKLMEYLASGRPTITTALPGIPEEYYPFVYLIHNETPEGVAQVMEDVLSKAPEKLDEFGQRGRMFVFEKKNWEHQAERIYAFMSNL